MGIIENDAKPEQGFMDSAGKKRDVNMGKWKPEQRDFVDVYS